MFESLQAHHFHLKSTNYIDCNVLYKLLFLFSKKPTQKPTHRIKSVLYANLAQMPNELLESIVDAVGLIDIPRNQDDTIATLNELGFNF